MMEVPGAILGVVDLHPYSPNPPTVPYLCLFTSPRSGSEKASSLLGSILREEVSGTHTAGNGSLNENISQM